MLPISRKALTAYVIFQGSGMRTWWRFFTDHGYRHVLVLIPIHFPKPGMFSKRYCMKIEPVGWGCDVDFFFEDPEDVCRSLLAGGDATSVVAFPLSLPPSRAYIGRGLWTCVTATKAILGIRGWQIWSPKRLRSYLLRHGGKEL